MTETEVWFRNPHNYIKELVETRQGNVTWDRGLVHKRNIDTVAHAGLYFGQSIPFRILLIGPQGTAELGRGRNIDNPIAVYPTWSYGEPQSLLEEIVQMPVGEDRDICDDDTIEPDMRPVFGQEHRVVITDIPNANQMGGKAFYRYLKELQENHPHLIIHLHGSYSYNMMFGMGYKSADYDPRTTASKGNIQLPSGQVVKYEQANNKPKWFTVTGFLPVDMTIPSKRCQYNIKSAVWAGENFGKIHNFTVQKTKVDTESSAGEYKPPVVKKQYGPSAKRAATDMITCNTCSLANKCKYERADSICTVPGADMSDLSKFFRTRDSGQIMDGLSELMAMNANRLVAGAAAEEDMGELDPEVTKIMGQIFDQGVKLAKLADPSLRGAKVAVNVLQQGGGTTQISASNPKELLAGAIREIERQGIKREDITSKMIEGMLSGMTNPDQRDRAIEGTIIAEDL
jgi:hypothetical protein